MDARDIDLVIADTALQAGLFSNPLPDAYMDNAVVLSGGL
jgi:hypothetical protein